MLLGKQNSSSQLAYHWAKLEGGSKVTSLFYLLYHNAFSDAEHLLHIIYFIWGVILSLYETAERVIIEEWSFALPSFLVSDIVFINKQQKLFVYSFSGGDPDVLSLF